MRVTLPDGSERELEDGASGADLAASIGPGLARAALAIRVLDGDGAERRDGSAYDEGRIRDLKAPLNDGERVEIVTANTDDWDSVQLIRHDTAHVLAAAVLDLYPGTKISIGPPIGEGFYYDFEFPEGVSVSDRDFEALEAKMREHVKADEPFVREDVPVGTALERFVREGQDYKVELIEDLVRDPPTSRPSASTPTARSPTSAAGRTRRRPSESRRSSCCRWRAPTGAAMPAARCSPASTAPPSTPRTTSISTCTSSRRPAPATTAASGATSACSCSPS